jgi:hypothetical protein
MRSFATTDKKSASGVHLGLGRQKSGGPKATVIESFKCNGEKVRISGPKIKRVVNKARREKRARETGSKRQHYQSSQAQASRIARKLSAGESSGADGAVGVVTRCAELCAVC